LRLRTFNEETPMRTVRYSSILITVAIAFMAGPTFAWAQSNAKEIMARKPAELVEILKNPQASTFEKAKACQRLAVVGTRDALPALAALLSDEKLNCYARCGLEGIADPAVDEALRDVATKLHGRQLVGVLDSIGQRKDAKAVEVLAKLLDDKDIAVASAAAGALGRIGTSAAAWRLIKAVLTDLPVKACAAAASLACAERLAASGEPGALEALEMYGMLAQEQIKAGGGKDVELPKHIKIAGRRGFLRVSMQIGLSSREDFLLAQLRSPDKAFFNLGLAVAREMPGKDVTAAMVAELKKLPAERRALLLRALADRKEPVEISILVEESKNKSPVVQEAAIHGLAKRGNAEAAAVLLNIALGDTKLAPVAKETLKSLTGRTVDAVVVSRLDGATAKQKIALFDLIGAGQIVSAQAAVRRAMTDPDEAVRLAAIAALAQLVDVENLDLLIDKALAQDGKPAETAAALAALKTAAQRMGDRDRCAAKLAEHLNGATAANRSYLLELLGKVSGPTALAAVVAGAKSSDPALKDAATRVLGEWLNADAASALLDIAAHDPEKKYQIRAMRGYIRIARQLDIPWWTKSNAGEMKLTMFRETMKVAKRAEEKRLALDILTRIPSAATLDLAASRVGEASLKDAAAKTAVQIAGKLVADDPKAVANAMRKVVEAGVGGNDGSRAKQLLQQADAAAK
jgi:HEAT repeat protein